MEKVEGLNALVSIFPHNKRLRFVDAHHVQQHFPFSEFAHNHNTSYPDLAATFPGISEAELPSRPTWSHYSMILEAKATPKDDPFQKNGLAHCKTLVQLAINARCLMHAHGLLATFVIGIYGDILRIARFDHTCAVVSRRYRLKRASDLKLLRRFFWHFVNPSTQGPIVGWDPTVRPLSTEDETWLLQRLQVTVPKVVAEQVILSEARRVEILDDDSVVGREPPAYIVFRALDVNGRLFSRATTVWLGVRDTRRWSNGRIVDIPTREDLKPRVIKEAWRQLARRPERDCYARLRLIPPAERVGLPQLLFGGDLGERETQQWERALYPPAAAPAWDDVSRHMSRLSLSTSNVAPVGPIPFSLATSSHSSTNPDHRPLQQTFSWRLTRGDRYWFRERSHMRFVTDTVGRRLTCFRCTKELVTALLDAIKGNVYFLLSCLHPSLINSCRPSSSVDPGGSPPS